jgi:hypothetical protein
LIEFSIATDDGAFLMWLLLLHPDAAEKIGCGISHFAVEFSTAKGNFPPASHFVINRNDGTRLDFSYKKCVARLPRFLEGEEPASQQQQQQQQLSTQHPQHHELQQPQQQLQQHQQEQQQHFQQQQQQQQHELPSPPPWRQQEQQQQQWQQQPWQQQHWQRQQQQLRRLHEVLQLIITYNA